MAQAIRVAILGAGRPGTRHAEGYKEAGGFEVAAVADLIPARRRALMHASGAAREVADALELASDPAIDAISICLPNHLHYPVALAALKAKKHVVCETPPTLSASEARKLAAAAGKSGTVLLYATQRRFGGAEQAARQAIEKGYAGEVYHARAAWMRTRAIPAGSGVPAGDATPPNNARKSAKALPLPVAGWYTDKSKSGGGVVVDLGVQMLDLAHDLLGRPTPLSVFAVAADRFRPAALPGVAFDVEDTFFALLRFEGNKTLELSASWAINQPPQQNGTVCRVHGDQGAIDVYTREGPILYRSFTPGAQAKATLMKLPRVVHYAAMMRHFRDCVQGKAIPAAGPATGVLLMEMVEAIYKSVATGKAVGI